jgi:phage tail-like protein
MAPLGQRNDPYKGFNFRVELNDMTVAAFREVSGLNFTTDPVEYREGTDKVLHVRKLTGLRKFANITLKRGITTNDELRRWYQDVLNGRPHIRRNGAIILLDEELQPIMRWNFFESWITNWTGPSFNATANDVAIESVELVVERVEME